MLSLQMDATGAPQWSDIAEVIRRRSPYTFVGRHRHAQGHEVAVEVNTSCFVEGGREYFLSVARDITRRMASEADPNQRGRQLWVALYEAGDGLVAEDQPVNRKVLAPRLETVGTLLDRDRPGKPG